MKSTLLIVDDFYANPDAVRNYALNQKFDIKGNFPGSRTSPYLPDDVKESIQTYMQFAGKITHWFEETGYSGAFQIATSSDRSWIHGDTYNMWAGVCYLTPDAPYSSGTAFYRHRSTGHYVDQQLHYEGYDITKYDLVDRIGNKYNRLILYQGNLLHSSLDYFGNNPENGRLFQTFFFDTEKYT